MSQNAEYASVLREKAQSILQAVQSLEERDLIREDDTYSDLLAALTAADEAAWSLDSWIGEGRPDL